MNMFGNWSLDGTRLILKNAGRDYYWKMPMGYKFPRPEVLALAEHILLKPYGINIPVPEISQSSQGGNIALAFSGGVDSAAAYKLLGKSYPIYTQVNNPGGAHKIENALLAVEEFSGLSIESNQDLLPLAYGKKRGFYGEAGWTVTSILLSDHFGFDTFADGNIIEFVYLRSSYGHGTLFKPSSLDGIRAEFRKIGYEYTLPCAGLTEVSTTKIAANYKFVMGCMRGIGGNPCLQCMKCYRKMALQGNPIKSNLESEKVLSRSWIPVLGSLLWARDHCGLQHPRLDGVVKRYDWVDKWFSDSIKFIPKNLHNHFFQELDKNNIVALDDKKILEEWSAYVE